MESTIFFRTKNNNSYLYDNNKSLFLNSHPLLEYFYDNDSPQDMQVDKINFVNYRNIKYSKEEVKYYLEKYTFLKRFGFFGEYTDKQRVVSEIKTEDVLYAIANIKQLVFEVTEDCNLKCKYCAYNDLFKESTHRISSSLSISKIQKLFYYLKEIWDSPKNVSPNQEVILSFYGGEPLLNIRFIMDVVKFVKEENFQKKFSFSITTNGVLLKKHFKFLFYNNFRITISLDGTYSNNQYRFNHNGTNLHREIVSSLLEIKRSYPAYFEKNIYFNTVLHDKNSIDSVYKFFKNTFGKSTSLLEINSDGAKPEGLIELSKMYKSISKSYLNSVSKNNIKQDKEWFIPTELQTLDMIRGYLNNYLRTYNDVFLDKNELKRPITGTCTPFWKKMFITSKGEILVCERIDYKYSFGKVTDEKIELDIERISSTYNNYYNNIAKQCNLCYKSRGCTQCMFYIENIESKPKCSEFHSKKQFKEYLDYIYSII